MLPENYCPNCGEELVQSADSRNFDRRPGGPIFVVSGLSQFTCCSCGIQLDEKTKNLLESIDTEPYRWQGTYSN